MKLTELVQTGDWKAEKHAPVIAAEYNDGVLEIRASIGDEIAHPNTLEHHIEWIKVFFQPEGTKFPIEVGSYKFAAHGEGEVFSLPEVIVKIKTEKKGNVYALSYCNIHGLWENSLEIK